MLPTNIPRAGVGHRPASAAAVAPYTGPPYAKTAIDRSVNLSVDFCWAASDVAGRSRQQKGRKQASGAATDDHNPAWFPSGTGR
jgi:hypothetical protein